MNFQTLLAIKDRSSQQDDSSKILEQWKLFLSWRIQKVDIRTIEQWMEDPKKESFINWQDDSFEDSRTMLHCAVVYGRLDIFKLLVEHGADINIANKNGSTALMSASRVGTIDAVELLLEKDADCDIVNNKGETALIRASNAGHINIVKLLLDKGADYSIANEDGDTALMRASWNGHTNVAELLSDKGADLKIASKDGQTALMYASRWSHTEIVEFFLNMDEDPNRANKVGNTALHLASREGHTDTVQLLLGRGADVTVSNNNGDTPLMDASRWGHINVVRLLLEKGADITAANKDGWTALMHASNKGHYGTVELLRAKVAADPNMCNSNGQTLLHLACLHNKIAGAEQVLELGTDNDKLDNNGHTALFYASEKGFADIVELLMKHNADGNKTDERALVEGIGKSGIWTRNANSDNKTDERRSIEGTNDKGGVAFSSYSVKDGRTPLFIAAQNGHQNVVVLLLQHGADPYLCNHQSQIPRDVSDVHGPIQQLFRIHDFFDRREKGKAYKNRYITCRRWTVGKKPVPPLEDVIHDIVKYPHFADKFLELYQENHDIVHWVDKDGRTVRQVACKECRDVTLFLGQYDLDHQPTYESPTCKVYDALDYGGPDEPNLEQPRRVAMKFMEKLEHFLNEMRTRRNDDSSSRFSSEFVTPDLAAYRAEHDEKYAKACKTWKPKNGSERGVLPDYCLVMPLGERSLLEAMNAPENLSASHKDLQRREILLTLSKIYSYLHGMGYVHGDVKPHNVIRHTGMNVSWKAIDFDACTKIGDVMGLKLTTGSAPPEMLKILKREKSDKESTREPKISIRQPGVGGLSETELVLADSSFDVWSFGILMYQLVTGRSFFHADLQGNLDPDGLRELAFLSQSSINEKLENVEDVNARVLLSRILRLDPKERPTMSAIGQDYYFRPSESPQGRKSEFFGKQVSSTVPQGLEAIVGDRLAAERTEGSESNVEETNVKDIESFVSAKSEFSYFKLRDEDKDWSDKLLNSEVETFRFDNLEGMGEKPKFIDGDTIYNNSFLRGLLSRKGPDYFMGLLVEYFELYMIMDDAHEVCQGIKANLVSDVKSLKGIFTKLFVRGKGLNDVVRGTLFCNSIDQFKYVGRQLKERYGHNVYIKPPKDEAGAWPIPKLLVYGNRRVYGRCMSVEIQFSTVYMHLATHASNNHLVYEAIRESTGYLGDKGKEFQDFLQTLNEQYIDTEGFLRSQSVQEGRFEIIVEKQDDKTSDTAVEKQYIAKPTGFILSGRISCGNHLFRFMKPSDRFQRFSESSFVVNKSLTLLSSHSYWSDEPYDLEGKIVDFVVSFKGRGVAIAGIGIAKCLHGSTESAGGGSRCSVHVGRSKFVVRKGGVEEVFREKRLPNQTRAKISFKMKEGVLSVSFVGNSNKESTEEFLDIAQVGMPAEKRYYLYMRAPPGVHDVKFHEVGIT